MAPKGPEESFPSREGIISAIVLVTSRVSARVQALLAASSQRELL